MKLVAYQKRLMEKGLKSGSTKKVEKAVRLFFASNELDFKMNGNQVRAESDEIPGITREQLKRIYGLTGSIRMKAIILMTRDSGLRISDICNLKGKDFEALRPEDRFYTITVRQQKTRRFADPVFGFESLEALRAWIRERERRGVSSEYLFVNVKGVDEYENAVGQRHRKVEAGEKSDPANISVIFRQLRDKAELREARVSIHSLRKYHKTNLEYAGVPTAWINKMQGRKGEGTGGVYTKPDPRQLIEMYSRGYGELTFERPESEEIKQLKAQSDTKIETLEAQVREMRKGRDAEIDELKRAVAELKKIVETAIR
jgi:integrase